MLKKFFKKFDQKSIPSSNLPNNIKKTDPLSETEICTNKQYFIILALSKFGKTLKKKEQYVKIMDLTMNNTKI